MWRSTRFAEALYRGWGLAVRSARLAVGVPDYDSYVAHVRSHHPQREPMSFETFFAERMRRRYDSGSGRCC